MDGRARFKASRPVYRRGGLLLSSASWTVLDSVMALTKVAALALIEDPVVSIEMEAAPDRWERLTAGYRKEIAANLKALIAADQQTNTQDPPPAPAVGAVTAEQSSTPAAGGGGDPQSPPPNDPLPAVTPPVGEPAPAPVANAPVKDAAKTGGKGGGAKPSPAKKSPPKQPASAKSAE